MPLPIIAGILGLVAQATGWAFAGKYALDGVMDTVDLANDVQEWLESDAGWAVLTEKLNTRLQAAGLDLKFAPFNPLTETGRESVKKTLDRFLVEKINAKAGTDFTSLEGLTQETFMEQVGKGIASKINQKTGAQIGAVWPVAKLQAELQSEVLRQFDNRGRYNGGALFPLAAVKRIKEKIIERNPQYAASVKALDSSGYWGPPKDEKHAKRREQGRARQARYKLSHQQTWIDKGEIERQGVYS